MKEAIRKIYTVTVPVLAVFAALVSAVWGKAQSKRAELFERTAEEFAGYYTSACVRCGRELSDSVSDLELSLDKLRVTASKSGRVLALEDIVRESASAVQLLCRLPQSQIDAMAEEEFLTRAGDYARYLSRRLLAGKEPSDEELEQLSELLEACRSLSQSLKDKVENGDLPIGTEEFDYYEASEDADSLEYPELVYDGPFAAAVQEAEPRGVSGREYSADEAMEKARELLGDSAEYAGRTEGRLPTWDYSSEEGEVSLTVQGLFVLRFMKTPSGSEEGVPDEAESERLMNAGSEFLSSLGYEDMEPTFSRFAGGTALITFVWRNEEVLILSDSINVWLDRETGEPCGLDASGYLYSHCERDMPKPAIDAQKALEAVSASLEVSETRLVLIALTPLTETLCYELRGKLDENEYLIFVNADTGAEEKIVKIIKDDNGSSMSS